MNGFRKFENLDFEFVCGLGLEKITVFRAHNTLDFAPFKEASPISILPPQTGQYYAFVECILPLERVFY